MAKTKIAFTDCAGKNVLVVVSIKPFESDPDHGLGPNRDYAFASLDELEGALKARAVVWEGSYRKALERVAVLERACDICVLPVPVSLLKRAAGIEPDDLSDRSLA